MNRRPLLAVFAAVAIAKVALLVGWGDRALLWDEESYRRAGEAMAAWLRAGLPTDDLSGPGRVAWHNPGYGFVFTLCALLPGPAVLWMRGLHLVAGLLSGVLLARALERRVGSAVATVAAAALWLHPSMLFFGVTLWPVAFATLGTSALLFVGERWRRRPDSPQRQWELGAVLAVLPFFASPALALLFGAALWVGPKRWPRVLGPSLVIVGGWTFALTLALGTPVPFDLAGARNLALGNNELVAEDRGSLWGDPERKAQLLDRLEEACGSTMDRPRLRCEVRWARAEARSWIGAHPGEAAARSLRRLGEAWGPDTFLPRHLARPEQFPPEGRSGLATLTKRALLPIQLALALAVLGAALRRETRPLLIAALLWSLPIALTVGLTRARQPLLPLALAAAALLLRPPRD